MRAFGRHRGPLQSPQWRTGCRGGKHRGIPGKRSFVRLHSRSLHCPAIGPPGRVRRPEVRLGVGRRPPRDCDGENRLLWPDAKVSASSLWGRRINRHRENSAPRRERVSESYVSITGHVPVSLEHRPWRIDSSDPLRSGTAPPWLARCVGGGPTTPDVEIQIASRVPACPPPGSRSLQRVKDANDTVATYAVACEYRPVSVV